MKQKVLVLTVALCLVSAAEAQLDIWVNGQIAPPGGEIWLNHGDTATLEVRGDGQTPEPLEGFILIEGPGAIDGHTLWYKGNASEYWDLEELAAAMGKTPEEILAAYSDLTGRDLSDLSKLVLADNRLPARWLEGLLIGGIQFRCEAAGDVMLTLQTDDPETPYPDYTITIHQTAFCYTYYVDANTGSDGNTGLTPDEAFATIQKAIDSAYDGDSVVVYPGRYEERINFLGKNITVASTDPSDSSVVASTSIDFDDSHCPAVMFRGTEDSNCVLAGFNINGYVRGNDAFLEPPIAAHTRATISRCVFQENGGDCGTVLQFCDGLISNCLFADNNYMYCAGLYPVIDGCHGLIKNCTIANSRDRLGIRVLDGTTTIENCILYNDAITLGAGAIVNVSYTRWEPPVHVQGSPSELNLGPGNIEADPCFADPVRGDYHLRSRTGRWDPDRGSWVLDAVNSLCVDAGNPGSLLEDEAVGVFNRRINIGAYGGTAEASKTPLRWSLLADLTNDGIVDAQDFAYQTKDGYPAGMAVPGDLNKNGAVDMEDIAALLGAWLKTTIWR